MSMNKILSANTTKYIPKYLERFVKRKSSNLNFIGVIKNSSFDQHFLYIDIGGPKPFKELFGDDFQFPAENVSLLAVKLYCV